jgi:membrane-bound lytic murein transglycosylase B
MLATAGCATHEDAPASPPPPPPPEAAAPSPVAVETPAQSLDPHAAFAACLPRLQKKALDAGIHPMTVNAVLANTRLLPQLIELDRKQPEFTETFGNYLGKRINDQRIKQGQQLNARYRTLLANTEKRYGVPANVLLAFWGLESNYGSFQGSTPTLDALATLACDGRREDFFTRELIEALHLVDDGIVGPHRFKGSWAGAVGNVQFMPSTYRRYAIDADGDKRPDLWRSIPDSMASAAHYLSSIGWKRDSAWGQEVRLDSTFDYSLTGLQTRKTISDWNALGVKDKHGKPLSPSSEPGSILVPSGHTGPAFLVRGNFDVIMRWNRSEFYALSVGLLADRIGGGAPLAKPVPALPRLSVEHIKSLQQALSSAGIDAGKADGILGPGTRAALRTWQARNGMIADGYPSPEVLKALGVDRSDTR